MVLAAAACCRSKAVIGTPPVVALEDRIAVHYDGLAGGGTSQVGRDVAVAHLSRPLQVPS